MRPSDLHHGLLAQAIGRAVIQQGYRVIYREAHTFIEEIADTTLDGTRKGYLAELAAVPLLIIADLGMLKLPHTAAEDLLEVIMRSGSPIALTDRAELIRQRVSGSDMTGAGCLQPGGHRYWW